MAKLLAALTVIGLQFFVYWYLADDDFIPARSTFAAFPREVGGWRCLENERLSKDVVEVLSVTDYLNCTYVAERGGTALASTHGGRRDLDSSPVVHLYVGYHERQLGGARGERSTAIHPPEHCLPGSGWNIVDSGIVPVTVDGRKGEAKRFVIAKGNLRNLVYFWYQSSGRMVARNHEKIFYTFVDRLLHQRSDGALVRFTIPIPSGGRMEEAEASFSDFFQQVTPKLAPFLPE